MCTTKVEEQYLCLFDSEIDLNNLSPCIKQIWEGDFQICSNSQHWHRINRLLTTDNSNSACDENGTEEFLCFGIACFLHFLQINFTEPERKSDYNDFLQTSVGVEQKRALEKLLPDDEEVNVNISNVELLLVAKVVFKHIASHPTIKLIWQLRQIYVEQVILEDLNETLFKHLNRIVKELEENDFGGVGARLKAHVKIEMCQCLLLYGYSNTADEKLEDGRVLLGMEHSLTGALGKRTKFQQTSLAQLLLNVNLSKDVVRPNVATHSNVDIVALDDEVRLNAVQYESDTTFELIPNTEQLLLLAYVQCSLRNKPQDELLLEEIQPYLTYILNQSNTWCVRVATLLLRCKLESKHKRTIERSLMQCEALVITIKSKSTINKLNRLGSIWACGFPTVWKTEAFLAELMINLGLVKASLDIYLRLQLWEDVILCYTILELRHKAAEVIQEQLKTKETVKLWCLLGDATDDVECYKKGWELSNHRSARAQRHWGQYLFAHKQYVEAIPHLQKSVELNSLQNNIWFRLGFAALVTEDWELAARCYRHYTSLESTSFEAWNNLAKAYIKLGNKPRAHRTLNDALKCNFDNWRVWENFLLVSCDLNLYSDVINAYHRLLDLKEKHLDVQVLDILVHGLSMNENETILLNKARELFGRLTSVYPVEGELWELYAKISDKKDLKWNRYQRAFRAFTKEGSWHQDPQNCLRILKVCLQLCECSISNSELNSSRLMLRTAVTCVKKEDWEECREVLIEVEDALLKLNTAVSSA